MSLNIYIYILCFCCSHWRRHWRKRIDCRPRHKHSTNPCVSKNRGCNTPSEPKLFAPRRICRSLSRYLAGLVDAVAASLVHSSIAACRCLSIFFLLENCQSYLKLSVSFCQFSRKSTIVASAQSHRLHSLGFYGLQQLVHCHCPAFVQKCGPWLWMIQFM